MKNILNLGLRLMIIALVAGFLLAGTNLITAQPIAAQAEVKANAARKAVMPEADSFELALENQDGINSVYACSAGYVYDMTAYGYGSSGVKVTVGVKTDGTVSGIRVDASGETAGLGAKAGLESYYGQYTGKNLDGLGDVNAITGATITSNAVKGAVELALEHFSAHYGQGGAPR